MKFPALLLGLVLALIACTEAGVEPTTSPASAAPPTTGQATPAQPGDGPAGEEPPSPDAEPPSPVAAPTGEPAASPPTGAEQTPEAQAPDLADPFAVVAEIAVQVEPTVVTVFTDAGLGSGAIWSSDGLIVTNHHVIANSQQVVVGLASGDRLAAQIVGSDPRSDLALLDVEAEGLPAAAFEPDLPRVGTLAIAFGSPLGFHNSVTVGVVSGLQRSIPGSAVQTQALVDLIQTDAAISPGNSGGPLVNAEGLVIGINVAHIPPQAQAETLGFAIPAGTVIDVVEQLAAGEPVTYPYLGVQTTQMTPALARRFELEVTSGAIVLEAEEGTPAAEAGIMAGDVIVGLAGERVERVEDMLGILRRHDPGDTVEVVVVRDGQEQIFTVELGEAPF